MPIQIEGLKEIEASFKRFSVIEPNVKRRFLEMIGTESLQLLQLNTPRDTGNLADSWQLQVGTNEVVIANDQQDLISFLTVGTIRHLPNPFIVVI